MKCCSVCEYPLSNRNRSGRCKEHWALARHCDCGQQISRYASSGKCRFCLYPRHRVSADRKDDYDYLVKVRRMKGEAAYAFIASGEPVDRSQCVHGVKISSREVIETVSRTLFVSPDKILGNGRNSIYVDARAACVIIMRKAGMSLPAIGRRLKRDHTTIRHAWLNADKYIARNPRVASVVRRYAA